MARVVDPTLNVQLEPRLMDALRAIAERERRTLRGQLELILDSWFAAHIPEYALTRNGPHARETDSETGLETE